MDPAPGDDVDDGEGLPAGPAELGPVPDPDAVGFPGHELGPRGKHDGGPRRRFWQPDLVLCRHTPHAGGRDEDLADVGTPVGELAVRAVDEAPILDELQDRGLLPGEQGMHGSSSRSPVHEGAHVPEAGPPAVHPHVGDLQHSAGALMRPAGGDGAVR